jgi:hypothetical protein
MALGLKEGDVVLVTTKGPGGKVLLGISVQGMDTPTEQEYLKMADMFTKIGEELVKRHERHVALTPSRKMDNFLVSLPDIRD